MMTLEPLLWLYCSVEAERECAVEVRDRGTSLIKKTHRITSLIRKRAFP